MEQKNSNQGEVVLFGGNYNETPWRDNSEPPIDATALNKIETGIKGLYSYLNGEYNGNITTLISTINSHLDNKDNPHNVTLTTLGIPLVKNVDVVSATLISNEDIVAMWEGIIKDETINYGDIVEVMV
jgi:hypothetical protein